MESQYPTVGVCGLSCRLCPSHHADGVSRCPGCKTAYRMGAGCPFVTCAFKRRGLEFCGQCDESATCGKWQGHRAFSREHDTFVCYQKLEANIAFIQREGLDAFEAAQEVREHLLEDMLREFNEGRSKGYYSIAATVMAVEELEGALVQARAETAGLSLKEKAKHLHTILDEIAGRRQYQLKKRGRKDQAGRRE